MCIQSPKWNRMKRYSMDMWFSSWKGILPLGLYWLKENSQIKLDICKSCGWRKLRKTMIWGTCPPRLLLKQPFLKWSLRVNVTPHTHPTPLYHKARVLRLNISVLKVFTQAYYTLLPVGNTNKITHRHTFSKTAVSVVTRHPGKTTDLYFITP